MPVLLPATPPAAAMSIGVVRKSNDLSPAFGGADQELRRKGSRYALTFTMPSMSYVDSMAWSVLQTEGITVVMDVYQPGFTIGNPGATPRVKGANQAGALLAVDGLTNGYIIKRGQFFSIITGGQRFLYRVDADVTVVGGEALVPLQTMLRRSPIDNDLVEILQPKIEGFVRDLQEVEVGIDHEVGLRFTVRERE